MKSFLIIAIVLLLILVSSVFAGGYNYDGGPASWNIGTKCNEPNQSPININSATNPLGGPVLHMNNITHFTIKNDHTIEVVDLEGKNYITFDGVNYVFKQVHFHTPSEHHINGIHFDAEAHFVFEDQNHNVRSVLAFLFKVSTSGFSKLLNSIQLAYPPKGVTQAYDDSHKVAVDLSGLPAIAASQPSSWAYRYTGSLTTPPCNGGITWWVATSIRPISVDQLNRLRDLIGYNSRPIQPRNNH